METKKSLKANLENKRNTFFLIGLVIALGTTLVAFEWNSKPTKIESFGLGISVNVEDEIIPITREPEVKPPPPPPPKVVEIINIVDDNTKLDEELKIDDTGADKNTIIDVKAFLQPKKEKDIEDKIFYIVEEPAEFPGGDWALYKYISNSVRYPVIAQENGVQGKVTVKFIVDEKGVVSGAEILRGVDIALDKEAMRVINSLPQFKPGKQRGKPVKVYYTAVINFRLQ